MIRRYLRDEYEARARALQAARPGLTLSTDVIVGFPGETDADFDATLELVREVGFVSLFGFKYSPRPRTPALKLGDDVPEAVKAERLARLFELAEAQQRAHLEALVGTTQRVLVEGRSAREGGPTRLEGRTERNEIVHMDDAGLDVVGRVVDVRVDRAFRHSLGGILADGSGLPRLERSPRRALPLAP
jgi:tRNA-2-methylthio-N6-dimethylallyladenosine synthase